MLNSSNAIILTDGTTNKNIDALEIEFGHERTLGKLEETVDGELVENFAGERLVIDVKFWVDSTLASWIVNSFLFSTSKAITIDSVNYAVVLPSKVNTIKLLKGKNFRGVVDFKFKKKTLE